MRHNCPQSSCSSSPLITVALLMFCQTSFSHWEEEDLKPRILVPTDLVERHSSVWLNIFSSLPQRPAIERCSCESSLWWKKMITIDPNSFNKAQGRFFKANMLAYFFYRASWQLFLVTFKYVSRLTSQILCLCLCSTWEWNMCECVCVWVYVREIMRVCVCVHVKRLNTTKMFLWGVMILLLDPRCTNSMERD